MTFLIRVYGLSGVGYDKSTLSLFPSPNPGSMLKSEDIWLAMATAQCGVHLPLDMEKKHL